MEDVKATRTTFNIIENMVEDHGITITELADDVGLHKSTIYKHLQTLIKLGYVEKTGTEYTICPRLTHTGEIIKRRDPLYRNCKNKVDELSNVTNEQVGLFVYSRQEGYDVYRSVNPDKETIPQMSTDLHCHAPGKAILAQLNESEVESILSNHELPRLTDQTFTEKSELIDSIEWVKERNIAFGRGEQMDKINSLAVPVTNNETPRQIGAVYIVGHSDQLSGKRFEEELPGILLNSIST